MVVFSHRFLLNVQDKSRSVSVTITPDGLLDTADLKSLFQRSLEPEPMAEQWWTFVQRILAAGDTRIDIEAFLQLATTTTTVESLFAQVICQLG